MPTGPLRLPTSAVGTSLWFHTMTTSRKARNIETNRHVAITVPVRRIPFGPPSTVHFQAAATLLDTDSPEVAEQVSRGELKKVTSHGELQLADGCFIRIPLPDRLITYGLGMSLRRLAADPLNAGGAVRLR